MNKTKRNIDQVLNYFPFFGISIFVALYIFSSTLYPGGSQVSLNTQGFDWVNNYWCNLMNKQGMNGLPNPARPYSILGMLLLCLSLMIFFIRFAQVFSKNDWWKYVIIICSIISMSLAMLIFTEYHDLMIILSSIFGFMAVLGVIRVIYYSDLSFYKKSGIYCLLLLVINNYIYYSGDFILALPLLQKVSFVFILAWILGLNNILIKRYKIEEI